MVPEARLAETDAWLVPRHWETDQEDFLVVSGEALLIVEGQERPLRRWAFVHCPSRQFQKDGPWGFYSADETAARYNASSPEESQDGSVADARFRPQQKTRYPGGLLPRDPGEA